MRSSQGSLRGRVRASLARAADVMASREGKHFCKAREKQKRKAVSGMTQACGSGITAGFVRPDDTDVC